MVFVFLVFFHDTGVQPPHSLCHVLDWLNNRRLFNAAKMTVLADMKLDKHNLNVSVLGGFSWLFS